MTSLEKLKEIAEAATPGEQWRMVVTDGNVGLRVNSGYQCFFRTDRPNEAVTKELLANIDYLDAFDPETALELIAMASAAALQVVADEPVAYMHTMHTDDGEQRNRFSEDDENPFGEPGIDYSESYPVTCTPLYTAAPVQPVAVPDESKAVSWLCTDLDGHGDVGFTKEIAKQRAGYSCDHFIPLFDIAAPAAQGDAKDAERYRFLRKIEKTASFWPFPIITQEWKATPEEIDTAIDTAIAAKAAS